VLIQFVHRARRRGHLDDGGRHALLRRACCGGVQFGQSLRDAGLRLGEAPFQDARDTLPQQAEDFFQ